MKLRYIINMVLCFALQLVIYSAAAQNKPVNDAAEDGELIIKETPEKKDACFEANKPVSYTLDIKSTFNTTQSGNISCFVTNLSGKSITSKTIPLSLERQGISHERFEIPTQTAGFYKINFIVKTRDYDDTIQRVFGVDIYNIHSPYAKPANFDAFWANSKAELALVKPEFKITEKPELSKGNDQVYQIEMKSLDNITIRGWMTLPKDRDPEEKLSAYVVLPGYWSFMNPQRSIPHLATFSIDVRGLGISRDEIQPTRENLITYDITDKNKYIYRGMIMDCVRLMDFICSQTNLDNKSICVNGGSMGGYLSLALSSLDDRVTLCTADNPSYNDYKWMNVLNNSHFPISDITYYAKLKHLDMNKLLNDLEYFNLKNFVTNLKAKTMIAIGLLDNFVPPPTVLATYNNIPASTSKELIIYPNLTHEVGADLGKYKGEWNWTNLGIENKKKEMAKLHADKKQKEQNEPKNHNEEITLTEHAATKDAIFKLNSTIKYGIDLKNRFNTNQHGTVSYALHTLDGKTLAQSSVPVSFIAKESKHINFEIPPQKTGFYKINFIINVNDYDDTVKRVCGVDIYNIRSAHAKPADFEAFWANAKAELARVKPEFKITEQPELEKGNDQIYLVEMKSLGDITIRAWLSLPKNRKPKDKFPVYLALPGFGAEMLPAHNITSIAYINLNVRGLGNSADVVHPTREEYLTYGIEDKNSFIYRGVMMDCIRTLDFICSRPELNSKLIFASGGSLGGFLSLGLASLDHRVTLCTANNPAFGDFRDFSDSKEFPMESFSRYAREKDEDFNSILNTLDYYDLKNFVPNIKCEVVVGMGLLDQYAPPTPTMSMYNLIPTKKKLFIFPNLAHEIGPEIGNYVGKWMYFNFAIL